MSDQNKTFAMSMFASEKDLYKAKAEHFEEKYNQMRAVVIETSERLDNIIVGMRDINAMNAEQAETIENMGRIIDEYERRYNIERGLD